MKRILVPTDFSSNAEGALRVAIDIAMRSKGTIILYHVYIPIESPFIDNEEKRMEHNIKTESSILKRMQDLASNVLKDDDKVTISITIGRSPLINNIIGLAEDSDIDLIVMGTKGASGIKKILMGSVAAKVAQRAAIPVLLIPENFTLKEFDHIVFATDFHSSDEQALSFTLEFSKLYKGKVTVVHILPPHASEQKSKKEKEDFNSYVDAMQRVFNKDILKFQLFETAPECEKIEIICKEIPHDMLVMVRGEKTFFQKIFSPSHTQSMACMTKRPLLIIPSKEELEEAK